MEPSDWMTKQKGLRSHTASMAATVSLSVSSCVTHSAGWVARDSHPRNCRAPWAPRDHRKLEKLPTLSVVSYPTNNLSD